MTEPHLSSALDEETARAELYGLVSELFYAPPRPELLAQLRADPELASIPCVAVSANAMGTEVARALSAGFFDYITKPFPFDRIVQLVDKLRT